MLVHVKGHQIEVTPALHDHAVAKFEHLARAFDGADELTIVLSVEKLLHKVEGTLLMPGRTMRAETTSSDMYAAIDDLAEKLVTQMRKHKAKRVDHHADTVRSARYS